MDDETYKPEGEGTNPTEETTEAVEAEETSEDLETVKAELERQRQIAKQAVARAKKAEQKAKPERNDNPNIVDERILISQGLHEDLLEQLRKVAQLNGTSLLEAQKDPLYSAYKKQWEAEEQNKKASLSPSKGASPSEQKKINSPNLSRDDHREMWKKAMGS